MRKQQLTQISAELSSQNLLYRGNIDDLLSFAKTSGMIEALGVDTILEEKGVALLKNHR
jgi:hypothetical protein